MMGWVLVGFSRSQQIVNRAAAYVPGGVNSHFRLGARPVPLVFDHADGAHLHDVDGNDYIDYYLGMGPMILGHTPQPVIDAVRAQVGRGILYAGQNELEYQAAELICQAVPCAQSVRFGSSGSEVVHAGFRLARAATGRTKVVKFEGHYHGWFDSAYWSVAPALADAGPREAPRPQPQSLGQPPSAADDVVVLPWNDLPLLENRLASGDVAAVFMEPFMFNTAGIPPHPDYLAGVRAACDRYGTLLIFDEVITGFRVGHGGAQGEFGVTPDLTTLGKAVANGFPVAALVGRRDLMDLFSDGRTVHGGTYNAQAVSMAATIATLTTLADPATYQLLGERGGRLMAGVQKAFAEAEVPAMVVGYPGVFQVRLGDGEPADYREFLRLDQSAYPDLAADLVGRGVRILPRGTWFVSTAHTDADIDRTLDVLAAALHAAA
jgi:glutamate-1-semialdehyde 2,1-aminomutase